MKKILSLFLFALSFQVYAWTPSGQLVSVDRIYTWQTGSADATIFVTSNGDKCYFLNSDQHLNSLVLTLFASGKKAKIHCYDDVKSYQGISAHLVHRIEAIRE